MTYIPTPSERLRAILNERLPHLTELTFGCRFLTEYHAHRIIGVDNRAYPMCMDGVEADEYNPAKDEMRGHNASIYDIVRALGENWSISGIGELMHLGENVYKMDYLPTLDPSKSAYDQDPDKLEEIIKLFN